MPCGNELPPDERRRHFRRIGAKGGQCGKGKEIRREIGRYAMEKRWAKVRAARAERLQKLFLQAIGK